MKIVLLIVLLISSSVVYGQTHIYNRYATHNNLEVAYLKEFPIDSTIHVNVTIIRAKNNRAWRWMKREFNIPTQSPQGNSIVKLNQPLITIYGRDKNNLRSFNKKNVDDNYALSISHITHTIIIYHCTNRKERLTIFGYENKQL